MKIKDDVYYRFVDLPKGINACTVVNSDNSYEVYINKKLCIKKQKEAVKHELKHIGFNHFYINSAIQQIEFVACNNTL